MFRSDLQKLSVMLVLLMATAFVSVATVAADDWYGQGRSPAKASGAAVVSDWFERHPSSILSGDAAMSTLDNPNGRWIGPETVSAALGQSAALSTLDNPSGYWIGPETVSAALSQLDDSSGHWIGPETVSAALGQLQP